MTDWAALRRTIEAATPGPWTARCRDAGNPDNDPTWTGLYGFLGWEIEPLDAPERGMVTDGRDADFIATARTAMPEMLALLEEAREALALLMSCTESGERLSHDERVATRTLIARLPEPRRQWRGDPDER